jgi:CheY-like chemotaxis protein
MISEQEILNASILIVDDQQSNVLLLREMLRDEGRHPLMLP